MASEDSLYKEMKTNAGLMFEAGFSMGDINEMMPFERDTYIQLWNERVEEKNKENNNGYG